ncbi:uncharacterized protein LOC131147175, partial [Malania oleifera]|uniref:uncharacterized protein LOC131147175 n=1 Tax=Malania oleifera TaxID=397392 RepID=UPI0025ADB707
MSTSQPVIISCVGKKESLLSHSFRRPLNRVSQLNQSRPSPLLSLPRKTNRLPTLSPNRQFPLSHPYPRIQPPALDLPPALESEEAEAEDKEVEAPPADQNAGRRKKKDSERSEEAEAEDKEVEAPPADQNAERRKKKDSERNEEAEAEDKEVEAPPADQNAERRKKKDSERSEEAEAEDKEVEAPPADQ